MMSRNIIVGVAGASGSIYAKTLLDKLLELDDQYNKVSILISNNAKEIWNHELETDTYKKYPFKEYSMSDFNAPFASGSSTYHTMIICPCSMGVVGRIAHGFSDDLMTRAADVILKEKRKLILVPRETPYSLIHIKNMELVSLAGGIICPATPSFYSQPKSIQDIVNTVVDRILSLAGFDFDTYRWNE